MKKSKFPLIYVAVVTAILYIPIIVAVIFSFNDSRLYTTWGGFSLRWYETLFKDEDIFEALLNSLLVGFTSCILSAVIATAAALGFRKKQPFSGIFKSTSMIPIMVPEIILGMAFLVFFHFLNLPFGFITLVIAHMTFCIPYIYLQVSTRVASLDIAPTEAARMLGAGPLRAFFTITLPDLLPSILSGMFIAFAMSFDDVIISMFVVGPKFNTLPIKIYTQVKTGITPEINALCTLMLLVTVICLGASKLLKGRKVK